MPAEALEPSSQMSQLLHERAIFACLKRIARGIDRFDRDLFLSGFHPDALNEAGVVLSGPEASFAAGMQMHEHAQKSTLHYLLNHNCDIDGDTAHAETYFIFVAHNRDDTNFATGGRYIDRLECRGGEWKVAFRHTILEWSGSIPHGTIPLFGDAPDTTANGKPSRSKQDPSYRRPLVNRRRPNTTDDLQGLSSPDGDEAGSKLRLE